MQLVRWIYNYVLGNFISVMSGSVLSLQFEE